MRGDTPLQASLPPRQVLVWDGGEEGEDGRDEMTAPDPEFHLLSGSAPADEVTPLRARDLSAEDGRGLTSSHPQPKTGQDTGLATCWA